jgi:hypothetical protein
MKKTLTALGMLGVLALGSERARADDHLANSVNIEKQVSAMAAERQEDTALLEASLDSPQAKKVAATFGTDTAHIRLGLAQLSDGEVRDLAARARLLGQNPTAGYERDVNEFLVVFLIVATVILVLSAVH